MIRRAELWGGLFWLAIGAFVAWQGWLLGLGTLHEPGSGFLFFWLGLLMCAFSVTIALVGMRGQGPELADLWRGARWGRVLLVIAALVVYGVAFEPLGFVPCTLALLLFLMTVVDPVPLRLSVPISTIAAVGVWYVLQKLLLIQLPHGTLFE